MKKIVLTLILVVFLSAPALGSSEPVFRDWTSTDVALEATFLFLLYQDWQQTRYAQSKGAREHNPSLGESPSPQVINIAVISAATTQIALADSLRPEWRTAFIITTAAIEALVVAHHVRLGYSVSF